MLEFKKPTLADMDWVTRAMRSSGEMACEYCFGNLYIWTEVYGNTIAGRDGMLFARDGGENPIYLYPCGEGDMKAAIAELLELEKVDNKPLEMYCLTPDRVRQLEALYPDEFEFEADRDYFDYIYLSEELASLAGRKLHSKRNHISFFKKTFDWSYEKITKDNLSECYDMNMLWEKQRNPDGNEELNDELRAIERAFEHFERLGFVGGLLRKDGEVIAYTFGEPINGKVFCTHVEKAFADVRGAYPMINQQFCQNELMSYKYINREDDTGDEGLRQAKESYCPAILLPKFTAKHKV